MQHLNTAKKYIEQSGKGMEKQLVEVTGKYMHPKYQRRIFFLNCE
jgi:tryptophan 2,3-dioxygenase